MTRPTLIINIKINKGAVQSGSGRSSPANGDTKRRTMPGAKPGPGLGLFIPLL